jgi:hypothetical protein
MFAQMLGTMELRPGQTQTWTARWDQRDNQGQPFPRGRCVLHARLTNVGGTSYSAPAVTIRLTGNRAGVDGPSDIGVRGKITRVQPLDDGAAPNGVFGTVLVEGVKAPDTSVDKAVVSVTPATRLLLRSSEGTGAADKPRTPLRFADLAVGQTVEVRFTGPVRKSYPVQATAAEVIVLASGGQDGDRAAAPPAKKVAVENGQIGFD